MSDMYYCPKCKGKGRFDETHTDGESSWNESRRCGYCEGEGEVDEETYYAFFNKKIARERQSRQKAYDDLLERQSRMGKTYCAHGGEEKTLFSFFAPWHYCEHCKRALCNKHAEQIAKKAPIFSFHSYTCPYCSGKMRVS